MSREMPWSWRNVAALDLVASHLCSPDSHGNAALNDSRTVPCTSSCSFSGWSFIYLRKTFLAWPGLTSRAERKRTHRLALNRQESVSPSIHQISCDTGHAIRALPGSTQDKTRFSTPALDRLLDSLLASRSSALREFGLQ